MKQCMDIENVGSV